LSFGLRDHNKYDPPEQWKYGYGIGKETYLTPAPWIYVVLFLVHVLFAGTVAFAQWTERGRDIVVGGLSLYDLNSNIFARRFSGSKTFFSADGPY
jgi:hypothetical protein